VTTTTTKTIRTNKNRNKNKEMPKRAPPLTRPPPSAAQKPQKRVLMVTTNQENAPENDIADVKALFLTAQGKNTHTLCELGRIRKGG